MLGEEAIGKVNALSERINELAKNADRDDIPKTGETVNLVLCIAMLLITGGALAGISILGKSKKHFVK